jgi:hypothetical protein
MPPFFKKLLPAAPVTVTEVVNCGGGLFSGRLS